MFITYPKIYNLGDEETEGILSGNGKLYIQEKLDGSNVQITRWDDKIYLGSHHQNIDKDKPEKIFNEFVKWVNQKESEGVFSEIPNGVILYGEMLLNQGKIKYKETHPFVLFDVAIIMEEMEGVKFPVFIEDASANSFIQKLNLPVVSNIAVIDGKWNLTVEQLNQYLTRKSMFGADEIEGIVLKDYTRKNKYGRPLFAKLVNSKFRERKNEGKFRIDDITKLVDKTTEQFLTSARLDKAIARLIEEGKYTRSLKDIPQLLTIIPKDILEENGNEIKEVMWKHMWKKISNNICRKVAEIYRKKLESEAK